MDYDKRRLITGSMDRSIVVYDVRNGEYIKKLGGHKVGINFESMKFEMKQF